MSSAPLNCLLLTIGSAGDVLPFIGLGKAMQRRGHRVTVVTGSYFADLVRRSGLEFAELFDSEHYRAMLDHPDLWHPLRAPKFVMKNAVLPMVRPTFELLRTRNEPGRTVVAVSSLAIGALAAQEKLGIPVASVHLQPVMMRSLTKPPKLPGMATAAWLPRSLIAAQYWLADRLIVDPIFEGPWNGFRREIGLPPVRRIFNGYLHSPTLTIGFFPEWYAPPQADWPSQIRLVGFPMFDDADDAALDSVLEGFLNRGAPPIAFTPGSAMTGGRNFFEAAIDACRRLGRRGLLLTQHSEQLPQWTGDDVLHVSFAPFSRLLPRCAAVVHHGGIGSLSQGFAAGVPQVIMPMAHDQHDNAERAVRLGVAAIVPPKRFRGDRLAAALASLLNSPSTLLACRETATRFVDVQATERAAGLLEGIAGRR